MAPVPASAALLHHLSPVEAGQLAESVITVNNRPLYDLGVPQEKAGFWGKDEYETGQGASSVCVLMLASSTWLPIHCWWAWQISHSPWNYSTMMLVSARHY